MSRELLKSMVYKDNKVYTRQCSNNVYPKNYDREENKGLTRLYQEKDNKLLKVLYNKLAIGRYCRSIKW